MIRRKSMIAVLAGLSLMVAGPAVADHRENHYPNGGVGTERVQVCHALGNGSYNLLEFDNSALVQAHLRHGDVLAENGVCPSPEPDPTDEPTDEPTDTPTDEPTDTPTEEPEGDGPDGEQPPVVTPPETPAAPPVAAPEAPPVAPVAQPAPRLALTRTVPAAEPQVVESELAHTGPAQVAALSAGAVAFATGGYMLTRLRRKGLNV